MISIDDVDLKDAKIAYAAMDFFSYCNLKAPEFYREDRVFLNKVCNDFQSFYESDEDVLVLNMPPRHGKSRTAGCFVEWVLGNNQNEKIMLGSYNEALSTTFSKNVRDTITEQKGDEDKIVYSEIFPNVAIKYGDSAMNKWSLVNGYNNYLATSPKGTSTGFGATLMIIDDLIKSALEANNADVLEQQWTWFTDTMLSRLEEGGKIIIIMTRWHSDDLAGRALRHFTKLGMKVRHICYKALQDDGTMLCSQILSRRSYEIKTKSMSKEIAAANYQQEPIDIKGRLYSSFKTYTKLPTDEMVILYIVKLKIIQIPQTQVMIIYVQLIMLNIIKKHILLMLFLQRMEWKSQNQQSQKCYLMIKLMKQILNQIMVVVDLQGMLKHYYYKNLIQIDV